MPQVDKPTLQKVKKAFDVYIAEVEASTLSKNARDTRIREAGYFVRWLDDDYTPGQGVRRR